jgi:uncharacterized protein YlzI (FlbEa/FlbD family)
MIEVTNWAGRTEFINPAAIVNIEEASVQSQYNGICCNIGFSNGKMLECKTTAKEVMARLKSYQEKPQNEA